MHCLSWCVECACLACCANERSHSDCPCAEYYDVTVTCTGTQPGTNVLASCSFYTQMVYSKMMERYPNNGKVLKCYGKFLEEVKNDISGATKYYAEGNRIGSTDAIMNM